MSKVVQAYEDAEWNLLFSQFQALGIEKTMNDYFHYLENSQIDSYKTIMGRWVKRYNVNISYSDKYAYILSDSTKIAIMESARDRMREHLLNYWRGRIDDLQEVIDSDVELPSFKAESKLTIAKYEKLIDSYESILHVT